MNKNHAETMMRRGWALAALLLPAAMAPHSQAAENRLIAPSQPLISSAQPNGGSAGLLYTMDSREVKSAGEVLELDGDRVVAEFGYEVAPFLQLAVQAGWTKAELAGEEGENGLAWAAIARANLAEHILAKSPEVGRKEWVGAAVDVLYRSSESNQDLADLQWSETLVLPTIYYFRNRQGDPLLKGYHATGFGLHGGVAFSFIDGEYGELDIEENRNFGFAVGADARWISGWIARLRATVYGSGDQTIEFGTLFHF